MSIFNWYVLLFLAIAALIIPLPIGLYLAFKASLILGFVVLLIEPSPWVIGMIYLLTGKDLAQAIVEMVSKWG